MSAIYAISFEAQQQQISDWCWSHRCGNGNMGMSNFGGFYMITCDQAECPRLDKQMDVPMGELDGDPVYLRKLREATP